jgi:hypothetical protein
MPRKARPDPNPERPRATRPLLVGTTHIDNTRTIELQARALEAAANALQVRRQAEQAYWDTIEYALRLGISRARIGRALGISRQAVDQLAARRIAARTWDATLRA